MVKATTGKRILAFFIDIIISSLLVSIICSFFDDPQYVEQVNALSQAYLNGSISYETFLELSANLVDPNSGIKTIIEFIILAGYFVVLPIFWKDQTIGRKLAKIKVIKENGTPATPANFIIREGFGCSTLFAYVVAIPTIFLNNSVMTSINDVVVTILGFILFIGFFTMLGSKKTTLYDRISKTIVVSSEYRVRTEELDVITQETDDKEEFIDL